MSLPTILRYSTVFMKAEKGIQNTRLCLLQPSFKRNCVNVRFSAPVYCRYITECPSFAPALHPPCCGAPLVYQAIIWVEKVHFAPILLAMGGQQRQHALHAIHHIETGTRIFLGWAQTIFWKKLYWDNQFSPTSESEWWYVVVTTAGFYTTGWVRI